MAIEYRRLLDFPIPEVRQSYAEAQLVLYALGLNVGRDPVEERELRYVYEDGLIPLPTAATILGYPGFWLKDERTGVDWKSVLHGEQSLVVHRPLPPKASVVGRTKVEEVIDKGARGAFIVSRRELRLAGSEELLCTLRQTSVARADGGFGGEDRKAAPPVPVPQRDPDVVHEHPTLPAQALLYRLNGDFNPLHADPAVARAAGFPRPILHGLCTYGIAGFAIAVTLCDWRADRIRRIDARFTGPVFPGETVSTSVWKIAPGKASFRCTVAARQKTVMDYGFAEYVD